MTYREPSDHDASVIRQAVQNVRDRPDTEPKDAGAIVEEAVRLARDDDRERVRAILDELKMTDADRRRKLMDGGWNAALAAIRERLG